MGSLSLTGNTATSLPTAVIRTPQSPQSTTVHHSQHRIISINQHHPWTYNIETPPGSRLHNVLVFLHHEAGPAQSPAPALPGPVQPIRHTQAMFHLQIPRSPRRLQGPLRTAQSSPPHSST